MLRTPGTAIGAPRIIASYPTRATLGASITNASNNRERCEPARALNSDSVGPGHSVVTVTTLCPGPTESEFKARAGSQRSRLFEAFVMDAPTVARVGYDAMMRGKLVAIPGVRNKLVPVVARAVPRSMIARLSHRAARPSEKV